MVSCREGEQPIITLIDFDCTCRISELKTTPKSAELKQNRKIKYSPPNFQGSDTICTVSNTDEFAMAVVAYVVMCHKYTSDQPINIMSDFPMECNACIRNATEDIWPMKKNAVQNTLTDCGCPDNIRDWIIGLLYHT